MDKIQVTKLNTYVTGFRSNNFHSKLKGGGDVFLVKGIFIKKAQVTVAMLQMGIPVPAETAQAQPTLVHWLKLVPAENTQQICMDSEERWLESEIKFKQQSTKAFIFLPKHLGLDIRKARISQLSNGYKQGKKKIYQKNF